MAEKSFGVKEINLIGASGTPTIESPNNLNLNAVNVAISTNATIGGNLTVSGTVGIAGTLTYEDVTNIDAIGIVTARDGIFIPDSKKIQLGNAAGNADLEIVHDTNNSVIRDKGTGSLSFAASGINFLRYGTADYYARFFGGGKVDLRYNGDVKFETTNTGATVTGTLAATAVTGDGSGLTGIAITEAPVTDYTISANGSSAYRIHGGGVDETANNPDLYLIRGQKYRFNNTTGSSHPFEIRVSNGGSAYTDGVSGDDEGVQLFTVPYAAPASLVYQCTIHGGMVGNIYIRGGSSTANISNNADNRVITGGSGGNLNGESTLTYDGTTISNSAGGINLQSTGGDLINVTSTDANSRSTIKFNTNGDDWEIGARGSSGNPNNAFYFYDNNAAAYRLVINSDGDLKVGTTGNSGAKIQIGNHTFAGTNFAYNNDRVGFQNNGSLTCISNCSTYNDGTHPGYGVVLVQGANTSSYNVWGICPDGPSKGNSLNLHYGAQATNIHVPTLRKFQFTGDGQFLKPLNPCFRARASSGGWKSFGNTNFNTMPFNAEDFDSGGNYNTSTYKFTVPVAGKYYFYCQMLHDGTTGNGANAGKMQIYVGSDIVAFAKSGTQGEIVSCSTVWNCAVGQEVYCQGETNPTNADDWHGDSYYSFFTGYLIG